MLAVGIDELMGCGKPVGRDGGTVTEKHFRKIVDMKASKIVLIVSNSQFQRDSTMYENEILNFIFIICRIPLEFSI